ncbi:low molecular weight protein-tyrosine-phosphatase [Agromyces seonyuensis]|uniref:protein-tyrosine-phosphatase n=1 Tax=Agromyces seonyuensis TaxID=2662446 RepID=A0A6I4NZB9_9MICO|nr:low molecular weight protein-tyrosine-phosphatase [Agromyces seonyuensis]MWB99663.1 low molecular weight phosphotyrosine protein phosphatase [Agromyces seonyuensis]
MAAAREHPEAPAFRVSFVCAGNICRSPMAEVVMRNLAERAGLGERIAVESAGTGDWHVGEHADPRALEALRRRGYDGETHRARQFDPADFPRLDLVVALDRPQARVLRSQAPTADDSAKVQLLLSFDPTLAAHQDVPDPYYSDDAAFDLALDLVERSTASLFRQLAPALRTAG